MKLTVCLLACLAVALSPPVVAQKQTPDALTARIQRDHLQHLRAQNIVQAEQARARQPLCSKAQTTLEINTCDSTELGLTNQNYVKLVRTLGALFRSSEDPPAANPTRIPFDDAETAWQNYRDLACKVDGDQYQGGSIRPSIEMSCQITVTRHHIDELWELYSNLGTQ